MCWPTYFVHQKKTSGKDNKDRLLYEYSSKCSQCGDVFDPETAKDNHVAAHVIAYPCLCLFPCCGFKSFKTTCKTCNNHRNAESDDGKSFWGSWAGKNPNLGVVCCSPFCCNRNANDSC